MSPTADQRRTQELANAAALIETGYLLLFRGKGWVSYFLRQAGRSQYSHAAMAGWMGGNLWCVESREFVGGRAVTLESQVRNYPGDIDVYKPTLIGMEGRLQAFQLMTLRTGCKYNYRGIFRAAGVHAVVSRLVCEANTDDGSSSDTFDPTRPVFCSEAVAEAYRLGAKADAVPNLIDSETEPADLGRSGAFQYIFTLVP